ncbi:hypothetical protein KHF85_15160 [Xanthomonas translucens pv. graminis]|uniref:hypothetical protein n=1 Tax=Xanthomonas graminis TaxID=3390026 RepID=UPI0025410070|nr:hypothetical protein [Xanthomonas translucens]WIH04138.1 hypothetical protein KHF85_15160 [Xanthomonas translucens pv. graminis]
MKKINLTTGIITALICSCSHQIRPDAHTSVDRQMVLPAAASRQELESKQVFIAPAPIQMPMPSYDMDMGKGLKENATICIEMIITSQGEVSSVRPLNIDSECAPVNSIENTTLFPKVSAALLTWSYIGAGICTYKEKESECDSSEAPIAPIPVKLAYKFRFSKSNGVSSEKSGN